MDYPNLYKGILIRFYATFFGAPIIVCLISIWLSMLVINFFHTRPKISDLFFGIVGVGLVILLSNMFIDCCRDLAYVKNNDYKINRGIVTSQDAGGKHGDNRGIRFQTDDGEIIKVRLFDDPIYKGEDIEVMYLPNSHCGAIIKRWGGGQEDTQSLEK